MNVHVIAGLSRKTPKHFKTRHSFTLSLRDLSRLGSGERFASRDSDFVCLGNHLQDLEIHPAEGGGPRGPSELERASHWAGVRGKGM